MANRADLVNIAVTRDQLARLKSHRLHDRQAIHEAQGRLLDAWEGLSEAHAGRVMKAGSDRWTPPYLEDPSPSLVGVRVEEDGSSAAG
jgi:hypothetical protein